MIRNIELYLDSKEVNAREMPSKMSGVSYSDSDGLGKVSFPSKCSSRITLCLALDLRVGSKSN